MRKITLTCDENTINTTCEGLSQHIHNRVVVHGLSARGLAWYEALPENHSPIRVTSSTLSDCLLDYITTAPIP